MRTDPMFYQLEVEDTETKRVSKVEVACWWSGEASIKSLHTQCDCQLAGWHGAKPVERRGIDGKVEVSWSNAHTQAQYQYLLTNKCDHIKPSSRFRPLRAFLPGGETVSL